MVVHGADRGSQIFLLLKNPHLCELHIHCSFSMSQNNKAPTEASNVQEEASVLPPREEGTAEVDVHCLSDVLPGANAGNEAVATAAAQRRREMVENSWDVLKATGYRVFIALQNVGEVVASILGLNESKFQYVIDNMTEEDWRIAKEVQKRREAELENKPIADMEGATSAVAAAEVKVEGEVER